MGENGSKEAKSKSGAVEKELKQFMSGLKKRNPGEKEFHQAVHEVAQSIMPLYLDHKDYRQAQLLERLTEPDRIVVFRVSWETDSGEIRANRAWRVQFNHCIGPYKGGLRFDPSVNQSILKFLGFEQIFKNSLTGLPMGGAKGGSNFNPKGKSDAEVMRFCHSLMSELYRHIGEDVDVPAGDIGVGAREISYMFGQFMRITNRWTGAITGKGVSYGGSAGRTEATGYGCIYFLEHMLQQHGQKLKGKKLAISGSGNVALYAAEKALEKKAKVLTLSDSGGFVYASKGLNQNQFSRIKELKEENRGRLADLNGQLDGLEYHEGKAPWGVDCDIALPCATQNELQEEDAKALVKNGVIAVCEGANMPTTTAAHDIFHQKKILFGPGKAANAGGVAVSGLEQSQNAMRVSWSKKEVDEKLQEIMQRIHESCVEHGSPAKSSERIDYVKGANIGGFLKVADAMLSYGAV